MNYKLGLLLAAVGVGALVAGLRGCDKKQQDNPAPASIAISNRADWTSFGDGSTEQVSNGIQFTNLRGNAGFASSALLFQNILGQPLNNSKSYYLHLVVQGTNGFHKLGITAVKVGDNPNAVQSLSLSKVEDLSDGRVRTLTYELPTGSAGLDQIALHFGANFGVESLGNPANSGVLLLGGLIDQNSANQASTFAPRLIKSPSASDPQDFSAPTLPDSEGSPTRALLPAEGTPGQALGASSPDSYSPVAGAIQPNSPTQFGVQSSQVHPVTLIKKKTSTTR